MGAELLKLVEQLDPGTDPLYARNPHAGLIVCRKHLDELQDYGVEPMANVIDPATVEFFGHRCELCITPSSEGRTCENEDCKKPLHPNWHAVYCCSRCALDDA